MQQMKEPHSPLDNPALTAQARNREGRISEVLVKKSSLSPLERMAEVEATLLNMWSYASDWRSYLDSPLIAHADAALSLGQMYDGVIGIKTAGAPYSEIFKIMGNEVFSIDYSHYKRNMENPIIDSLSLGRLKAKNNVLLVDIDIVTGQTIRKVISYLRDRGVNVTGAYIGLSAWSGMDSDDAHSINEDSVDFSNFWKICGNTRQLKTEALYRMNIISRGFRLFSSNGSIEECYEKNHVRGLRTARGIASYLLHNETKNN